MTDPMRCAVPAAADMEGPLQYRPRLEGTWPTGCRTAMATVKLHRV